MLMSLTREPFDVRRGCGDFVARGVVDAEILRFWFVVDRRGRVSSRRLRGGSRGGDGDG